MASPEQQVLREAARLIHHFGRHTDKQLVGPDGSLDVLAAIYWAATNHPLPAAFSADEDAALELIRSHALTMRTITLLSASLPTDAPESNGHPDRIEHVTRWASEALIGEKDPPTVAEVIGRMLRISTAHPDLENALD